MDEAWVGLWRNRYPEPGLWELELQSAERVLSQGKGFLAVAQGERDDLPRMRFALASYLLIAEPGAYFRYGNADTYEEAWIYDDELVQLGAPAGQRYLQDGAWRRDFECGYVSVDPDNRVGLIARIPDRWRHLGC